MRDNEGFTVSNTEERKDKCVYVHKLDGVVVYVGSGNVERATNSNSRKGRHLELWKQLEKVVVIKDLTLEQSQEIEQELLDKYWDTGLLFNISKTVAKHRALSYEYLNKHFYIDETSPSGIRWKSEPSTKTKMHTMAGTLKVTQPYYVVQLEKVLHQVSRVVWVLHNKQDLGTGLVVDHIDRDSQNNKPENLRAITQSENTRNKKHRGSNTGEQCICNNIKDKYYAVYYTQQGNRQSFVFSYNTNSQRPAKNLYKTKELAFEAAINQRNLLVAEGKIILT